MSTSEDAEEGALGIDDLALRRFPLRARSTNCERTSSARSARARSRLCTRSSMSGTMARRARTINRARMLRIG
jgi:hypothetical protein